MACLWPQSQSEIVRLAPQFFQLAKRLLQESSVKQMGNVAPEQMSITVAGWRFMEVSYRLLSTRNRLRENKNLSRLSYSWILFHIGGITQVMIRLTPIQPPGMCIGSSMAQPPALPPKRCPRWQRPPPAAANPPPYWRASGRALLHGQPLEAANSMEPALKVPTFQTPVRVRTDIVNPNREP